MISSYFNYKIDTKHLPKKVNLLLTKEDIDLHLLIFEIKKVSPIDEISSKKFLSAYYIKL
ncbi:hypothetical protein DC080_01845 [Ignatzschineria cameli]|nr:hypothetical protein DC080_01845 [Ignatzschineria cameli]